MSGLIVPLVLLAVAVAAIVFAVGSGVHEKQVVRESLRTLDGYDIDAPPTDLRQEKLAESIVARAVVPAMARLTLVGRRFTPMGYVDKVRHKFVLAGIQTPDSVDRFLAMKAVLVPVGIVFGVTNLLFGFMLDGMMQVVASVVIGGGLAAGPDLMLNRKVEERQTSILRALPDVLDLLTISVEAGLGFEQALDRVIAAVPGHLSDEFARMLGEARAGASRADAMRAMDERMGIPEVRAFVLAIIQADAFGVSIGRVLRAQADEMRIKRRQIAQEKAQKAPVKMLFPMVFCILPALFAVVLGPAILSIQESYK
ncbi:MAG: type II secretion system F family protein [Microthrixaceae bacterium]|nr:type II secretion system F family protein [Microthrixaceae bacterium]HMT62131.1 type II secretion system F family protein [Microthrixaceae bacterium]